MKILTNTSRYINHSFSNQKNHKSISKTKYYSTIATASPLVMLFIWYSVCQLNLFPVQILAPPEKVWHTFMSLIQSGEITLHLKDSLSRLFIGFSIASLSAILFGISYSTWDCFYRYTFILFNVLYQIPIFVLIPIFILIFGIGEVFKIILIIKACFFPIALATADAVRNIPKNYLEVGQLYQLKTVAKIKYIIFPSIFPKLISGLRISLGRAWLILVAVELLAAGTGIGQMMELGRQMLRLDIVMVGVFITGIIGFMLDKLLRLVENHFSPAIQKMENT